MVHGLGGRRYDLILIQRVIAYQNPTALFMHSGANQGKTDGDLALMGQALANEVQQFLGESDNESVTRINFIGYSLGGLIIRSALPLLMQHRAKFRSLVTIGTPHLGYLYQKGTLFNTGMMLVNKLGEQQVLT